MAGEVSNNNPENFNPKDSPFVEDTSYSLESILADIKGSSFIEGERGTPVHILEAEAERILREAGEQVSVGAPPGITAAPAPTSAAAPAPTSAAAPAAVQGASQIRHNQGQPAEPGQASASASAPDYTLEFTPFVQPVSKVPEPGPGLAADPGPDPFEQFMREPVSEPAYKEPASGQPVKAPARESSKSAAERLISEVYERYDEPELYSVRNKPELFDIRNEPEFTESDEIPIIITPTEDNAPPADNIASAVVNSSNISSVIGAASGAAAGKPAPGEKVSSFDISLDDRTIDLRKPAEKKPAAPRSDLLRQVIIPDDEPVGRDYDEYEEIFEEPPLKNQARKFARSCNSLSRRLLPASIIMLIMVLITIVFEAGMAVPYGIGYNLTYAACALIMLLLVVMMLCVEVVIRGADMLAGGNPGAETLVLFSCIFSLVSATFTVMSETAQMLPFCAVSALSLVMAAFGERSNIRAMTDSLKVAVSSPEPYGLQAQYNENLDNSVLKKSYNRTEGFYSNLVGQDITEIVFQYAAPVLLISSLFLTVINVLINGVVENSLHILSALLAASAPLSALLSYSIPFGIVSKALSRAGVALAGWGGADDIAHTDGVCITDNDLFPPGTLGLTAVKVFDGAAQTNVLCYTASLIIASGSGLSGLFTEALQEKNIRPQRIANFQCHESGISGVVQGHQAATGSAAYMNLIGVRVPDDSNMRNAIFTAVNGRLTAMFTIDYKPLPAVQRALISLLKWRIDLFFAMRDFNITPSMVGQKFKVPFESFVFMSVKDSYSISDPYTEKHGRMAAILVRESLGPYAEAITGARLFRSAAIFATIISAASAGLGVMLMFLMLWDGSFLSATPVNLMIYKLCILTAVLLVCGYVKIRK